MASIGHSVREADHEFATPVTPTLAAASGICVPVKISGSGATFTGTYTLRAFAVNNGEVVAIGTLNGTLTNALGQITSIVQNITLPVHIGQATCDILHLELGPITVDLLGLQIDFSQIVLDVNASSSHLLGSLLCAVAGLFDQPTSLAKLLNDILAAL